MADVESKFKSSSVGRGSWSHSAQFLITTLGLAVGLGNIWRFPNVVYKNGGAAFIVAYFVCVVLIAAPLLLLEASVAQYSKKGPIQVWKMVPLLQGVGFAMLFISFTMNVYYSAPLAWAAYYSANSFNPELPWRPLHNDSGLDAVAAECYFYNETLKLSPAVDELGVFRWDLYLYNAINWAIIFFCVFLGPKSLGKISYFTSLFPYVMLTIMVAYTATLPGAYRGVQFYISHVDWSALLELRLWRDATAQALFSTSCAGGAVINLASYNDFHHNLLRDALVLPVADTFTSIFAGFSVFAVLGHIAERTNATYVGDVVEGGVGLIFITYPEFFAAIDGGHILSAVFFPTIVLVGISCVTAPVDMYCSAISDAIPALNRTRARNLIFRFCIIVLLCGLSSVVFFGVGYYWYLIMDDRAFGFPLILIALVEVIGAGWIYNEPFRKNKLLRNIEEMVGGHWSSRSWKLWNVSKYVWLASWTFIAPATLVFIFFYDLAHLSPLVVNDYVIPKWALNTSWIVNATVIFCILAGIIIVPCWRYGGYAAWLQALKQLESWKRDPEEEHLGTSLSRKTVQTVGRETSSFL